MRCTVHPTRESAGYCAACGNFYCEACLTECEDGKNYCDRCRRKLGKNPKAPGTARTERLATRILVKYKNGAEVQGTTYKIDPNRIGFNLITHDSGGAMEDIYVEFADIKYAALVESARDASHSSRHEYQPKGSEVVVTFTDEEVLKGFTLKHYSDSEPRFSVIPSNLPRTVVSTIVERSAVAHMSLGRIPKAQELRSLVNNSVKRLIMHYYWKHPDIVITIDELAARLGREARIVDRELAGFVREGLISRVAESSHQLRFTPPKDHVVRQAISTMGKEIDQLYFRKRGKPSQPAKPRPQNRGAIRWPL